MTLYDVEITYDAIQAWTDVIEADDVDDAEFKALQRFKEDNEGENFHNVNVEFIKEVKKQ